MSIRRFPLHVVGFFVVKALFLGAVAEGSVLPLVEDASVAGASPWWVESIASEQDRFFFALFAASAHGSCVSPEEASNVSMSRVLRTRGLSANNARSIGSVLGCAQVFWGRIEEEETVGGVAWLSLRRSTLRFRGRLLQVSTGATVSSHDLRVSAYAPSAALARAEAHALLRVDLERLLTGAERQREDMGDVASEETLVVRTGGSAAAYVALLSVLPDRVPGVAASQERWATEGRVGVHLVRRDGAHWDTVEDGLNALRGAALPGVIVRDVHRVGELIIIDVAEPEADDERL